LDTFWVDNADGGQGTDTCVQRDSGIVSDIFSNVEIFL
jgi:hypothetical protein